MKLKILINLKYFKKNKKHRGSDVFRFISVARRDNRAVAVYIICIDVSCIKVLGADFVIRLLTVLHENIAVNNIVIARIIQHSVDCRLFALNGSVSARSGIFIGRLIVWILIRVLIALRALLLCLTALAVLNL